MQTSPATSLKDRFKAFLLEEAFRPGITGLLTNPFYIARKGLYENVLLLADLVRGRVLDVGCGRKPYEKLFNVTEYVGLELDTTANRLNKRADVFYDGKQFPFDDASFDTVIANQVLEHVFRPAQFLKEINRVLRPKGGLLLTVPFLWDEHEQPLDYARYTSFGLKYLLETLGFEIVQHRKSVADARLFMQLFLCYLHKRVARWNPYARFPAWVIFSGPLNLAGEVIGLLLPRNQDLYLDNIVYATKVRPDEGR